MKYILTAQIHEYNSNILCVATQRKESEVGNMK